MEPPIFELLRSEGPWDERKASRLQELARGGCDINAPSPNGCAPIHLAAMGCQSAAALALLRAGADLRARYGPRGDTPIHLAALACKATTEALLLFGADPNEPNFEGQGPIFDAIEGQAGSLAPLLAAGADPCSFNAKGLSALRCACEYGSACDAALLLAAGADSLAPSPDGLCCEQAALLSGNEAAHALLRARRIAQEEQCELSRCAGAPAQSHSRNPLL